MSEPDHMDLRLATMNDSALVLQWRNDESARRWFADSQEVSHATHNEWMKHQLSQSPQLLWIGESSGRAVGSVRIAPLMSTKVGLVSVVVDHQHRNSGIGSRLIHLVGQQAQEIGLHQLQAQIHIDNAASLRAFERNGYRVLSRGYGNFMVLTRQIQSVDSQR